MTADRDVPASRQSPRPRRDAPNSERLEYVRNIEYALTNSATGAGRDTSFVIVFYNVWSAPLRSDDAFFPLCVAISLLAASFEVSASSKGRKNL
jgi:hypothetical protein